MRIDIITPGTNPVSLENLKLHLSMNDDSADDLLSEWLDTALEILIDCTGFVPTETELIATITDWQSEIILPRSPIVSVESVTYTDTDGEETELNFTLQTSTGKVTITSDQPETDIDNITVEFTAGTTCPAKFKTAIKLLAAHLYANREAYTDENLNEVPVGFLYLMQQLRGSLGVACND